MACVVGEDGCVAGGEVEGAGCGLDWGVNLSWEGGSGEWGMVSRRMGGSGTYVSDEGCGAGGAGEEVEPFFGLDEWRYVSEVLLTGMEVRGRDGRCLRSGASAVLSALRV